MSRIEVHQDLNAINALLIRDCFALDQCDFETLAREVFAPEATFEGGGVRWQGAHPIAEGVGQVFSDFEGTAHFLSNAHIEIRGDHAHSFAYVTAWHWMRSKGEAPPGRPADWVLVAAYRDSHLRTEEGWRIERRVIENVGPSNIGFGEMPRLKL
jgi:hypothetical protein